MKLKRETYRHIEAEIRDYAETVKRLEELRRDIYLQGRQEADVVVSGGGYGTSQTERRATLLADSVLFAEMGRVTKAIRETWDSVPDEVRVVAWVKYGLAVGDWKPPSGIREMMKGLNRWDLSHPRMAEICLVDERTWYNHRARLINKVAEKLGWW